MGRHLQQEDDSNSAAPSKEIRLVALIARAITATTLLVAIIIFKINRVTLQGGFKLTYSYFDSYLYTFYVAAIGLFYSIVQLPFAVYYFLKAKRLLNHYGFVLLDFYTDKATSFLLATAIGAAFGATFDLKKIQYEVDDSKYKSFYDMNYVPIVFFLVGFITSAISSVLSSLALPRKL